ncbi:MAG: site-2 protease family protein [Planctomycetota bacterium]
MRWSLRIGQLAGIDVKVHATFALLLLLLAYLGFERGWPTALLSVALVLCVFTCVVLHELGHALMARRFGVRTRDITLYPIGGVARLERIPEEPYKELLIAIAGPAVNLAIAGLLGLVLFLFRPDGLDWQLTLEGTNFLGLLLELNLLLMGFNVLPAFPMDGGRVLRALLSMKAGPVRATKVAGSVGKIMAVGFTLVGVTGIPGLHDPNPILVLIGFFVYAGASQEMSLAQLRAAMSDLPVGAAMIHGCACLNEEETVAGAVEKLLFGVWRDFPILANGEVVGMLTRDELLRAVEHRDFEVTVSAIMRRDCGVLAETDSLEEAVHRMARCGCRSLPVVRDGVVIGIVSLGVLHEFMTVRHAFKTRKA